METKFRFCGAGANNNLAITKKQGHVYQFGLDIMNQNKPDDEESVSGDEKKDGESSSDEGDRPIEANLSFGMEKFEETVMERVHIPGAEDESDLPKDARVCSAGGNHQMVLNRSQRVIKSPAGTCHKYAEFPFVWGTSN